MNEPQTLPSHLTISSLFKLELVLKHDDAVEAVNYLAENDYFVFAWEGWLKTVSGQYGHLGQHQGTVDFWGTTGSSLQQRIEEAANFIKETITASQQQWDEQPEVVGAALYFCLSIEKAK